MQTRTSFNSSPLVRCLAGLGVEVGQGPGESVAERLALWLDWTDADALFTELQGGRPASTPVARPELINRAAALIDGIGRTRAELARAIDADPVFTDPAADAATCRRHAAARQHAMETRLAAVRASLRAMLAAVSPALGRLATLDALMERALAARERQLLAAVPASVAKDRSQPGPAMQRALLAELDTRLQPIEGMVAALAAALRPQAAKPGPA